MIFMCFDIFWFVIYLKYVVCKIVVYGYIIIVNRIDIGFLNLCDFKF